jgi:serine phosphatase RsbU (regulator of sigma subunit)
MIKKLIPLLLLFITTYSYSLEAKIDITSDILGESISHKAVIREDLNGKITIETLLTNSNQKDYFKSLNNKISNLDFTTSTFWLKFSLNNTTDFRNFVIETGRPITNIGVLYEVENGVVINIISNGDDLNFNSKSIPNRKMLFPIKLEKNEQRDYYIKLMSDGEVLTLPLIIYEKDAFNYLDANQNFFNGIYYGGLMLIVIIYFFFYLFLKDKSFLYYILYVTAIFFLQFSLDGYSFQYIFKHNSFWVNHSVLLTASLTMFMLLQYAQSYLNLKTKLPNYNKLFNVSKWIVILLGLLSLVDGTLYKLMYPLINGFSFISIVLILFTIYKLTRKGTVICGYFSTAFTVLMVGAIIFILGNFNVFFDPIISQNALKLSSGLEVIILSISMATKYRNMQNSKEKIQAEALVNLAEKNKLMDTMNHQLEVQVKERTSELNFQKEESEIKTKEILSSIEYALRIQEAILPCKDQVKSVLPDSFIFYKPKDVVSGDFYFVEKTTTKSGNSLSLFAAVDCTGHGVPGAFMSIVGNSYLRQSIHEQHVNSTGEVLDFLNQGVSNTLRQNTSNSTVRDGMDIALCAVDFENLLLYFSGAKNPVFIVRDSKIDSILETKRDPIRTSDESLYLNVIKGDSHPIGAYVGDSLKPFTTHKVNLKKGDVIYVFSDGFADQFGGEKGKKYNIKHFKHYLLSISQLPMSEQQVLIEKEFHDWQQGFEQVDDICVIGVRI